MREHLNREPDSNGVYAEINMSPERPVTEAPSCLKEIESEGVKIRLHEQNIMKNLQALYDSKYFVKIDGRRIRGNSVVEAISAGCLFLWGS